MSRNILVIAAHPDDEILGCGGVMTRLTQEGARVYIAIFGEGITSRYRDRAEADTRLLEALHTKSHEAAKLVGARELFLLGLPDNRFDTVPLLDVIKHVEDLVEKLRPEIIFTHHQSDVNIDHVTLNRAVLTATRPVAGHPVKELYTFEVPSSSEWSFGQFTPAFTPNVFFDIDSTLSTKIQAMEVYESEARPFPHPRSPQALEAIARRWGSVVGLAAAEAFALVRSVR